MIVRRFCLRCHRHASCRPSARAWIVATALSLVFLAAGCGSSQREQDAYPSQIAELVADGEHPDPLAEARSQGSQVYEHYCRICHGELGQGDGFNSTNLAVPPRDFSDEEFWKSATEDKLRAAITGGGTAVGKSVLMPAWGNTLSDEQVRTVIAYLRTVPDVVKQQEQSEESEAPN